MTAPVNSSATVAREIEGREAAAVQESCERTIPLKATEQPPPSLYQSSPLVPSLSPLFRRGDDHEAGQGRVGQDTAGQGRAPQHPEPGELMINSYSRNFPRPHRRTALPATRHAVSVFFRHLRQQQDIAGTKLRRATS